MKVESARFILLRPSTKEEPLGDEPVRTGEERVIRDEFKADDEQFAKPVPDDPGSSGPGGRRSKFIDLYGDEDGNPKTTEKPGSSG